MLVPLIGVSPLFNQEVKCICFVLFLWISSSPLLTSPRLTSPYHRTMQPLGREAASGEREWDPAETCCKFIIVPPRCSSKVVDYYSEQKYEFCFRPPSWINPPSKSFWGALKWCEDNTFLLPVLIFLNKWIKLVLAGRRPQRFWLQFLQPHRAKYSIEEWKHSSNIAPVVVQFKEFMCIFYSYQPAAVRCFNEIYYFMTWWFKYHYIVMLFVQTFQHTLISKIAVKSSALKRTQH